MFRFERKRIRECAFDQEAFDIGNNSYLKIALFLETKDNFWEMGDQGPWDLVLKFISICVLMKKEAVSGKV
jgi:hypothetical protein